MNKQHIRAALEQPCGTPEHVISISNPYPENKLFHVLDSVDVLFIPPAQDAFAQSLGIEICITAGISSLNQPHAQERFEFGFYYTQKTTLSLLEYQTWADSLVKFALQTCLRDEFNLPFMVEDVTVQPFAEMTSILVVDWVGLYQAVYLQGLNAPVRLMRLIPLYENEARFTAQYLFRHLESALQKMAIDYDDYERKPANV